MSDWIYSARYKEDDEYSTIVVERIDATEGEVKEYLVLDESDEYYSITKGMIEAEYYVNFKSADVSTILKSIFGSRTFYPVEGIEQTNPNQVRYHYVVVVPTNVVIVRVDADGETDTVTINRKDVSEHAFENILRVTDRDNYASDRDQQDDLELIFNQYDNASYLESITDGNIVVDRKAGVMYYKCPVSEERIYFSDRLRDRIIKAFEDKDKNAEENEKFNSLIAFSKNLAMCPDTDVVHRLYDFIEPNNIMISNDGMVICYKKVNSDFTDIYTGTMDNSPGQVLEVRRDAVDSNSDNTCSHGLHVCSYDYLQYYGASNTSTVVVCKVHPADFVAIPYDYNDSKARVCRYEVIDTFQDHFHTYTDEVDLDFFDEMDDSLYNGVYTKEDNDEEELTAMFHVHVKMDED